VATAGAPAGPPADPPRSSAGVGSHPTALLWAGLAACTFGVSLYATGRAGTELPAAWVVLSARAIGMLALFVPLAVMRRLRLTARAAPLVAGSGVAEVLGFFSYTVGARHGIAIASVLSSQFAAISVVAAYFLFSERLSRLQLAGITTLMVGVALLSALRA
jgi:drug/metabolite transporter (DMT)-like permease